MFGALSILSVRAEFLRFLHFWTLDPAWCHLFFACDYKTLPKPFSELLNHSALQAFEAKSP